MRRREFLGRAGAGLAAAALTPQAATGAGARRRPNVIFAFSDEHRWHSMAHTELPALHTPNMRRLAEQGASLRNCISNYPVCSPYRAMLITGRWPWQTGIDDNSVPLSANEMTLGKAFRAAGYATSYIGKWHLGGTRAEPFGFDHSLIWTNDNIHWDVSYYHPKEGDAVQPKGYNATLMTDQAVDFMTQHKDDPFFMVLSWNPPHAIFTDPPPAKKALYPEGALPRRANTPEARGSDDPAFSYDWPNYQGYHAHISAIDDELGRLMQTLDTLGIADDTILIYSSDHGSMMGSQGLGGKRQPYEESIRVPFIVRWPGHAPAGAVVDALVGTIDLFPTLCGLAGVSVPPGRMGADCSAWLRGGEGPRQEAVPIMHLCKKKGAAFGENHPAPLFRGVRTEQHVYAVRDGAPWILYDLQTDPLQLKNLCDAPDHANTQAALHARAAAMFEAAGSALT